MSIEKVDVTGICVPLGEDYPEIRESVRRICKDFPGEYWRDLDARSAYPDTFVRALTDAGYLSVLIPEAYGGAGLPLRAASVILEEIHASGCSAGACHAQMYTMGTLLRHGSEEQKKRFLPDIASCPNLVRPANYPEGVPGKGYDIYSMKGVKYGVINLVGRVFMSCINDPFQTANAIIQKMKSETHIIFIDFVYP